MGTKGNDKEMGGEIPTFQLNEQDSQYPWLTCVNYTLKTSIKENAQNIHSHCMYQPFSSTAFVLLIESCFSPGIPLNHCLHFSDFPA